MVNKRKVGKPPTEDRIRYVVGIAVRAFLAAYRVRKAPVGP
jgi:hypothetical protein